MEDVGQGACQPIRQPLFAVEVIHSEGTARCKVIPSRLERLLREEVALQAQSGLTGEKREGVRQCENDEIVCVVRALKECPTVIVDAMHARVLIRMVRMELHTNGHQFGINLDGVDRLCPVCERRRDVVAVSRADHQDPRRRSLETFVDQVVVGVAPGRDCRLMRNAVRIDKRRVVHMTDLEPVIRGPNRICRERADREDSDDGSDRHPLKERRSSVQHQEEDPHHDAPRDRTESHESEGRESYYPGESDPRCPADTPRGPGTERTWSPRRERPSSWSARSR